jgi:DNA-binding IclR family transcriptional regulator
MAVAVWGSRGPTIVRIEESPAAVHVTMRHGTVESIVNTASGRLFAAFLPVEKVRATLEDERSRERPGLVQPGMPPTPALPTWEDFEPQLAEVRAHGLSRSEGAVIHGVSAMAAPVFDHGGAMVMAVTAIGPSGSFDARWGGALARALLECAQAISQRLGAQAAA